MNTIFLMMLFNVFFIFSKWHVSASENEEILERLEAQAKNLILPEHSVTEYYESGKYKGLIKEQFALIENEAPVSIGKYTYEDQSTTIIDAFDNKTIFRQSPDASVSVVEKYDDKDRFISKESLILENSHVVSKTLEDKNGRVLICERYFYNDQGEIIDIKNYTDIKELSLRIEEDVLPANEMFCYLNELLTGENLSTFKDLEESYFGPLYLMMAGYYNHPLETGVYGFGEVSDLVRITFINGILNRNRDCMENAQSISNSHGGVNVHYVYRPTVGWANDLINGLYDRLGVMSSQAVLLANTWKELIAEMGGVDSGGVIIHYAHSIGASDTWNARTLLTKEEKNLVRVVTIGSPFMIHKDGLHSVVNYVSVRDGVSYLDFLGLYNSHYDDDNVVVFLGSFKDGLPFIDHPLSSATYQALLYQMGQEFISEYGIVQEAI